MSLDVLQAKLGVVSLIPPDDANGYAGGAHITKNCTIAPAVATTRSGGAVCPAPRERVSGDIATLASSGTITHNNCGVVVVTTGGAVTGAILQAGTVHGQLLSVLNNSANTITFAAAGTSNVLQGTSAIIPATSSTRFVWNAIDSRWYGTEGV